MSYRDEVREVRRLSKLIEQAEADADAWKWERAERIATMCETRSQREVAKDVGIGEKTVRRILAVWRSGAAVPPHARGSYTEAYYAATGDRPNHGAGRTSTERAATARELMAEPEVRKAVVRDPKVRAAVRRDIAEVVEEEHAPAPAVDVPDSDDRRIESAIARAENALTDLRGYLDNAVPGLGVLAEMEDFAGRLHLEAEHLTMFINRERRAKEATA